MEEIKKQVGRPKGSIQPKKPTNAELTKKLNRAEAESKALQDYVTGAIVCIPRDEYTKVFHNDRNGVTITVTDNHAIIRSITSARIFPKDELSERSVYSMLYTYVDIMNDNSDVISDEEKIIIQDCENFMRISFVQDSFIKNSALLYLETKNQTDRINALLDAGETQESLTFYGFINGIIKRHIRNLGTTSATTLEDITKMDALLSAKYDNFFENELKVFFESNGGHLIDRIIAKPTEISESEALAEMMFNEQSKEQVM